MIKYWNLYFHPFRNRSSANTCSAVMSDGESELCSSAAFRHRKNPHHRSSSAPSWPDAAPMSKLFFRPLR